MNEHSPSRAVCRSAYGDHIDDWSKPGSRCVGGCVCAWEHDGVLFGGGRKWTMR